MANRQENSHPFLLSTSEAALKYCIHSYTLQLERDVEKLEKVLQRPTVMGRGHGRVLC